MKRSKPLTPVPWQRKTAKTAEPDPITPEVRTIVRKRSKGLCELCGITGQHMHHRQLRRAGDHSAANIVHLCFLCHRRAHGHPDWALSTGWLVSQYDTAAHTPLLLHNEWVLLDRDGQVTPAPSHPQESTA